MPDVRAMAAAAGQIIWAAEWIARLRGLDAPRRTVNGHMSMADVEAMIKMAEAEVQRLGEQRAEDERRVRLIQAQPLPDDD